MARADAEVINFDNLAEGKIVGSSDLPAGFTISVNNRNTNHPDTGIIFDSACPPGNVDEFKTCRPDVFQDLCEETTGL